MKEIVYSPEYRRGILELRDYLLEKFGENTAKKVIKEITEAIDLLSDNEELGKSLNKEFGIDTDYRYLYRSHTYIFYKADYNYIYVEKIFNEREDFMRKLFKPNLVNENTFLDEY